MRRSLVAALVVSACYRQSEIRVPPEGTLQIADESWRREPGDRVRLANGHEWSPAVPVDRLVRGGKWICATTDVPLAAWIASVRITDVDHASLEGLVAGLDKPTAHEIENGVVEVFLEGDELESWTTSRAHVEPLPARARYELKFYDLPDPLVLRWDELVELHERAALIGWPIAQVRSAKLERGDPRTRFLIVLPLLPVMFAGAGLLAGTGIVFGDDYLGKLERFRRAAPRSDPDDGWRPRLCDPRATYTKL